MQIVFDPNIVTYEELLELFWRNIDPTTANRQFCDAGTQYRTAIFYHNEKQRSAAEESKKRLEKMGKFHAIATEIVPASPFYPAEQYHQQFHQKNPFRYQVYKQGSGREKRLRELWDDQN